MIKKQLTLGSVVVTSAIFLLSSCNLKPDKSIGLQVKIDSLVNVLADKEKLEATMMEAETLLDSIDASRHALRYKMWEGTSYDDFTNRMTELNEYVKKSELKIEDLENSLKSAKQSGSSYSARIASLKKELEKSNLELAQLQTLVDQYKNENDNLIKTVNLQQAEIDDKLNQINTKQEEVAGLETRITQILDSARQNEADAYFARAQALELAADRTNFAPKKKRSTQQQALDMYRMAVLYGKDGAQAKVDELAKKL